jgi:hypothetical protein
VTGFGQTLADQSIQSHEQALSRPAWRLMRKQSWEWNVLTCDGREHPEYRVGLTLLLRQCFLRSPSQ